MSFKTLFLWFLPCVMILFALCSGGYNTGIVDVLSVLFGTKTEDVMLQGVIFEIRMPRILGAMIVGAGLCVCGAVFQAIFKNPLADPYTLGVSNGAGFGAALGIIANFWTFAIQLSALFWGIFAVGLTFALSLMKRSAMMSLILSGLLISSLFSSLLALLKFLADPFEKLPQIVYWLLGSFTQITYEKLAWIMPGYLICLGVIYIYAYKINIMSMGDDEARSFGVNLKYDRCVLIFVCTLLSALLVSISGVIGWVGVLIPHLARFISGPDFRRLFFTSISLGISYMILVDTLARSISANEIPIGVITGVIGIIVFCLFIGCNENRN